jgi:alkyl sulfatase BDS1-like metallo-beta-lactamase superfamily hydrolase
MADSPTMATKEACEAALLELAQRLDGVPDSMKRRHAVERSISCHLPDLDTTYSGRLADGALCDITEQQNPAAQIRLTVSSDDLVAVTAGELPFMNAWSSGRLRIEASMLDMLRLRAIL